ncbi:hypothetical protein Tco_1440573, partial [Tanacetum coccineum]
MHEFLDKWNPLKEDESSEDELSSTVKGKKKNVYEITAVCFNRNMDKPLKCIRVQDQQVQNDGKHSIDEKLIAVKKPEVSEIKDSYLSSRNVSSKPLPLHSLLLGHESFKGEERNKKKLLEVVNAGPELDRPMFATEIKEQIMMWLKTLLIVKDRSWITLQIISGWPQDRPKKFMPLLLP